MMTLSSISPQRPLAFGKMSNKQALLLGTVLMTGGGLYNTDFSFNKQPVNPKVTDLTMTAQYHEERPWGNALLGAGGITLLPTSLGMLFAPRRKNKNQKELTGAEMTDNGILG